MVSLNETATQNIIVCIDYPVEIIIHQTLFNTDQSNIHGLINNIPFRITTTCNTTNVLYQPEFHPLG